MSPRLRALVFAALVYAAFFASGAASLMAEVTWNRMLIVVVGNSLTATAMIVAIFMGGLGLGSFLGGRVFTGRRSSLWTYTALELAVGSYVLASPVLFDAFAQLFTTLAQGVHHQAALTAARIAVTFASLLVPAMLMGATFPAIVSAVAGRNGARTGYLYSINTLGAAIGCYVGGYHLLLQSGVRTTLWVAAGCYLVAIACAAGAALSQKASKAVAEATSERKPVQVPFFLAAATFGIGFVALAYEVLLTRLVILYVGNLVSVFPLVLTGFLVGTGLSAVLGNRLFGALRGRFHLFGWTALASSPALIAVPYLLLSDWIFRSANFAEAAQRNPLPIIALVVVPTLLIGALLPIAIRRLDPEDGARGASTLYALNTAGGLLGAGFVNHHLVPLIGTQGCLTLLALVCAAIAAVDLLSPARSIRRWSIAAAAVAASGLLVGSGLPNMMRMYAAKIALSTNMGHSELKLLQEGRAANVTVLDHTDARATYRDMFLNGIEEASTRFYHAQLFKLLGIVPVLTHASDGPHDVLVIAFGAGITSGSVLAVDSVQSLDVVDLNPDIEKINDLFTAVNGDVFHQPRFHFHNDDGRNYLVTTHKRYDVISSDSTHPRAYDSWILYTKEFYQSVKARLRPGGVFAQWVPVDSSMQGELFRIHLNTFRSVFPNATLWYVYGSDQAFLLGSPEPWSIDVPRLQQRLNRLPAWFRAADYQIDTVANVAGFFWLDPAAMDRLVGGETRVDSDNAHFFDNSAAIQPLPPQLQLPAFQASVLPLLRGASDEVLKAAKKEQDLALQLAAYHYFDTGGNLARAFCMRPENGDARYWTAFDFPEALQDPAAFCREQQIRDWKSILARHPDDPEALNSLADLLCESGRLDEALPLAEKAARARPQSGMILDTKGWILFKQKRHAEAVTTLSQAARLLPDHPLVLAHLDAARKAARETR